MLKRKLFLGLFASLMMFSGVASADTLEMHEAKLGIPANLKFLLTPEARCTFGDLDVIALDKEDPNTSLQLSVEEFGGSGAVFYGEPKSSKEGGYHYSVDLAPYKRPAILGVYLCSVKKGEEKTTPCGKFPARSYDELVAPYKVDITRANVDKSGKLGAAPIANPGKIDKTGRIYFFKFLVLDGKGNVTFPKGRMNEDAYKQVMDKIQANKGRVNNANWELTRLKMLGQTLGSEPLGLKDGIITVTLPHYDKKKCTK